MLGKTSLLTASYERFAPKMTVVRQERAISVLAVVLAIGAVVLIAAAIFGA